jgi:hypothetical protein
MTDMLLIAGWCFAVSLFLPVFVWALMPLLPRAAATRHLAWLAMFTVLLVLPLLVLIVPSLLVLQQAVAPSSPALPGIAVKQGWSMADWVLLAAMAWLLGAGFHLARLALGLFGLHRLRRESLPFEGAQDDARLAEEGPIAFGVLRPLILLPHDAACWPHARLQAVLAHERAHLRRRDCLTQLMAEIVCAFYWPNLLLWLAARNLRQQAEIAADNEVLAAGMRPSDYAAELLGLAGQNLRLPAVAMAAPSLEARVKSVLSPLASRNSLRALDAFRIAWLGCAAALALALVRPAIAPAVAEVRNDPPVPAAPHAPAPPSEALPAADAPPTPGAPPAPSVPAVHHHHRIAVTVDGDKLTDADKAKINAAVAQVRASMATLRPEIERAIQQAHVDQAAAQSVQKAMPQIHAAIARAMTEVRPVIDRAVVDEHVEVKVSVALERAQAQIDAALAEAARNASRRHAKTPLPPDPPPSPGAGPNP